MAAFSYPFLLDSIFIPNPLIKMPCSFLEEPADNISNTTNSFSEFHQTETLQDESSCFEHSTKVAMISSNEPSLLNKNSSDSSSMVDKLDSGEQVTQKLAYLEKKRRHPNGSSLSSSHSKHARELKGKKQKNSGGMKDGEEKQQRASKKDHKKVSEEAPTGYVHVRARRGQATDSHSLAERVRREKISERMKMLQAIVPACDKVTGKAMMLDEIINYVQSLQNQVEFLSMKLASLNPMFYDFGMDFAGLMVNSEGLSSLESPLQIPCSSTQAQDISLTTNTFSTPANSYPLLDSSLQFQQGKLPNNLSQANGQLLWDVDGQRQNFFAGRSLKTQSNGEGMGTK